MLDLLLLMVLVLSAQLELMLWLVISPVPIALLVSGRLLTVFPRMPVIL
jgi:hypothetical protein